MIKKKVQSGENILTIVCLSRELFRSKETRTVEEFERRNEMLRAFPSTPFISCSTWRRCLPGESGCSQACLFVRLTVVQLNLKPEAPLSALLLTNNEIERFLRGREHDRTTRCFINSGDRKYSFLRLKTYELKRHVQLYGLCCI